MLCIEASVPSLATQVEEIRDSEDNDSDASGPSEDDNEPSPPAAVVRSSLPAQRLRYFTLTELYQPLM
jgi:hypothetical protein